MITLKEVRSIAQSHADFDCDEMYASAIADSDSLEAFENAFIEAFYEASENAKQWSPFEVYCHQMNNSRNPDRCWEVFDQEVAKAARKALKRLMKDALLHFELAYHGG